EEGGVELAMRVGINTGDVVTATGIDREGLVTGEPVNLAARLESLASPGSVVVGQRTQRDTRHAFSFRSLGEVAVKGYDRPVQAVRKRAHLLAARGDPQGGRGDPRQ